MDTVVYELMLIAGFMGFIVGVVTHIAWSWIHTHTPKNFFDA